MSIQELYTLLKSIKLPVVYHSFKASGEKVKQPPYIIYFATKSNNTGADNKVYFKRNNFTIELYTEKKDNKLEQKLEGALDSASIFYDKIENYLDTESMYQISYQIEI
jgi:hypothetical protein